MELHKLLVRQLHRIGLTSDVNSLNQEKWQQFLERINNAYLENDKERYLVERSMEISSQELLSLNERLEDAQHIARLGYWLYDLYSGEITWSKEMYHLLGIETGENPLHYENFIQLIEEEDRKKLQKYIARATQDSMEYDCEVKIFCRKYNEYRWFHLVGHKLADSHVLSNVAVEINRRKKAEEEISSLHDKLLSSARRAGMAEVATSILHNVGNILNSANVSVTLVLELFSQPYFKNLFKALHLLKENKESLENYLTQDAKGKLIPKYLIELTEVLESQYQVFNDEFTNLNKYLQHVKEIVMMQRSISGVSGLEEKISLLETLDSAFKMTNTEMNTKNIVIEKKYPADIEIICDKSKLLQILVNLIQNAKDSVVEANKSEKNIGLAFAENQEGNTVKITVEDNGMGIANENFINIFNLGFTTKVSGHGFGLHSSALTAKELGGALEVESSGIGKGAKFTLTLPLTKNG